MVEIISDTQAKIMNAYGTQKTTESLSFLDQLHEQVTLCRRLLTIASDLEETELAVSAVLQLETLLYPQVMKDEMYKKTKQMLIEFYNQKRVSHGDDGKRLDSSEVNSFHALCQEREVMFRMMKNKQYADGLFKLLLLVINSNGLMPMEKEKKPANTGEPL